MVDEFFLKSLIQITHGEIRLIDKDGGICRIGKTKEEEDSLGAFCRVCREMGYEIYPMDVIQAGDEFYATMKRSTNGGGENSPKLEGEDDLYEMFFASLEQTGNQDGR